LFCIFAKFLRERVNRPVVDGSRHNQNEGSKEDPDEESEDQKAKHCEQVGEE
jgi:hypothetical protein